MSGGRTEEYEDCFLAYLDIMGFKDKVKETETKPRELETLIEALKINTKFTQSDGKKTTSSGTLEIRSFFFSDSFLFTMKAEDENLPHLFLIIRYLQDRLWEHKLCLRGTVVKGNMYWPKPMENIILGPAMIEAYKLESEVAIYPRIVVSENLYRYIKDKRIPAYPLSEDGELKEFIKKDKDGVYFFDILNPNILRKKGEKIITRENMIDNDTKFVKSFSITWNPSEVSSYKNIISAVKKIVRDGKRNQNPAVKQKYGWLSSYLEECRKRRGAGNGR